jgi:hypothetical protein
MRASDVAGREVCAGAGDEGAGDVGESLVAVESGLVLCGDGLAALFCIESSGASSHREVTTSRMLSCQPISSDSKSRRSRWR